ncbi:MAG: CAP domain-containing protein [Deltaproteobacteria bacterium]|nr:CAP domain-containing protein [Deltaproteobacteria bacterium]
MRFEGWQPPGSPEESAAAAELLQGISEYRFRRGLVRLKPDPGLGAAADYLAKVLADQAVRNPEIPLSSQKIDLSYPLALANIANRQVSHAWYRSGEDGGIGRFLERMFQHTEVARQLFYRNYTHIGGRIVRMPGRQLLASVVLGSYFLDLEQLSREVLDRVNQFRLEQGSPPVEWSPGAARAAAVRAAEIQSDYSHTRPGGRDLLALLKENQIRTLYYAENIAKGEKDAAEVMDDWINSPAHRKSMVNPDFNRLGVGVIIGRDGQLCWTQIFYAEKKR